MARRDRETRLRQRQSQNVGPLEVGVEDQQEALRSLARALKQEENGKQLRSDLTKGLKKAMEPMQEQAKSNLLGISSAGLSQGQPLRQSVAKQVKVQASTSGRRAGARLRVRKQKGMPRGFNNAPKALNNVKGWRHPVFGDADTWVAQTAHPTEWFDRAVQDESSRAQARKAVLQAMEDTARRIGAEVGG